MKRGSWVGMVSMLVPLALGIAGCLEVMLAIQSERCRVASLALDALDPEVSLRARIRMQVGGRDVGFDAIAERRGGPLQLVGLAPTGTRLFALTQEAKAIVFAEAMEGAMKSLATMTLDALRRGLWIEAPPGQRGFSHGGETVWEGEEGGIRRRNFQFSSTFGDNRPNAADVSIEYRPNPVRDGVTGFEIQNSSCGYEAVVILLEPPA